MKLTFSKFSKSIKSIDKNDTISNTKDIKQISFTGSVVHVGRVLTINDINNNRSSKYSYLSF